MMIDLHCHLLPGIDDGSASMEESLAMLHVYQMQGVSDVVCTPHVEAEHLAVQSRLAERFRQRDAAMLQLKEAALRENIAVRLYGGAEFVLTPDLPLLLSRMEKPGLAGSEYLLVELPPVLNGGLRLLDNLLFAIQMAGFVPILAHPERAMRDDGVVRIFAEWVRAERLLLQVNAGSLILLPKWPREKISRYQKRRRYIDMLLEENLVFCIASDAHNVSARPVYLEQAKNEITARFGAGRARDIFETNPGLVLAGAKGETYSQERSSEIGQ